MNKFHVYLDHTFTGPYEISELWELPGFTLDTIVCLHGGEGAWQPASQFPAIQRYRDNPEQVLTETDDALSDIKLDKSNWRAAVIESNVEYTPLYTRRQNVIDERTKTVNYGYAQPRQSTPEGKFVNSSRHPKLESFYTSWLKRRKEVLGILAVISVGANLPQINNYMNVYAGMTQPQVIPTFILGTRVKRGGLPHPWHPWKHSIMSRITALSRPHPPADEITLVDTEDVGDGTISKTVVVTHIVNGVKTHQTKTYFIKKQKKRSSRQ